MGCACSKKAVVDDDPFPALNSKASRRSSSHRYTSASFRRSFSRPLSGPLTSEKDEQERRKRLQQQQQQQHHHTHLQQQEQQQKQHQQEQLIKPKYNAQRSGFERGLSSRRRERYSEGEISRELRQNTRNVLEAEENPRSIPKHNEGEQAAAGWPGERDSEGVISREFRQNIRNILREEENPRSIRKNNEGEQVSAGWSGKKDRNGGTGSELRQNIRNVLGVEENPSSIPKHNEGERVASGWPGKRDRNGGMGNEKKKNIRNIPGVQENPSSVSKHNEGERVAGDWPRERDREGQVERVARENIRNSLAVQENPRNIPKHNEGEQVAAGWPAWLSSAAGEAIKGWIPRRSSSFEKLEKIGQGTYSNVYKARDLESRNIVALKKVRFDTMDADSVKFMAREIIVLRRLDHPNVIKLEGVVTSRMSSSLYLVFKYMEHDLAGLASSPGVILSEPQVKLYMFQLLSGLQHCHDRNILHRDIKGSNLLLDNSGTLKIADFGLATTFGPSENRALTSRVVTLWYRAPELLLGAIDYGVGVDLWSVGCILAELFAGKPIMPARTEVEQLHKIFKMCGSPSEEYWEKSKLPHATIFKPQQPYKRCVTETFKDFPATSLALLDTLLAIEPSDRGTATQALRSEFFTTPPYACDPSSLPRYIPSKEWDAKMRDEENRRRREKARNDATQNRANGGRDHPSKAIPALHANAELQANLQKRRGEAISKSFQTKSMDFPLPPEPSQPPQQPQPHHHEDGFSKTYKETQPTGTSQAVARSISSRSGPLGPPLSKKTAINEDVRMAPSRPTYRHNMSTSDVISQGVQPVVPSHQVTAPPISSRSGPLGPPLSSMKAIDEDVQLIPSHLTHHLNVSISRDTFQEILPVVPSCEVAVPPISSMSGPLGPQLSKKKAINEDVRMAPSRPNHRRNMSISEVISQSGDLSNFTSSSIGTNDNNKNSFHKDLLKDFVALSQRFSKESLRIPTSYIRKYPHSNRRR